MALFNNPKENRQMPEEAVGANINNIIGKGTTITGDIETIGNIRIDGKLKGNLKCKAKVALGNGSVLTGNIYAQNAEIEGEVTGTLEIAEILILKPTAVITGDIFTSRLVVEAGAKFNGSCKMGEKDNRRTDAQS